MTSPRTSRFRPSSAPAAPALAAGSASVPTASAESVDEGRRQMLRRLGTGAAGALAGGALLAAGQASPAAAANGDHLVLGDHGGGSNAASATTELRSSGRSGTMGLFVVQDGTVGLTLFPAAVQGFATEGVVSSGVYGYSSIESGFGVVGIGTGAGIYASGGRADIALNASGAAPYSTATQHTEGDMIEDNNADLWVCVTTGTPGTFRKVAGPGTAGQLHLLPTPTRVYDSRPGNAPALGTKSPLANGSTRDIDAKGNGSGVPDRATAVLANFTVVNTSANGFLAAYRAGIAFPGTSTLNWSQPGTIVANTTIVAVSSAETFRCFVPATSSTDFFVDVIGYFL